MVKLRVSLLRYLHGDEVRVLQAVELGMRNHEFVPTAIVTSRTYTLPVVDMLPCPVHRCSLIS